MLTKKIYKKDIGRFVLYGIVDKPPVLGLIISTKQVLLKVNTLNASNFTNTTALHGHLFPFNNNYHPLNKEAPLCLQKIY